MEKRKLKVGDKVWFKRYSYYAGTSEPDIIEAIVTTAGTKYFTIDKAPATKFEIETGKHVTDYLSCYKIWFSLIEYEQEQQLSDLRNIVAKYFRWDGNINKLTIEQLSQIKEIICAPSERSKILSIGVKNGGIHS